MFDNPSANLDIEVRIAAFDWLSNRQTEYGDVFPRQTLPLVGPQGIFKPKVLSEIPLSITVAPKGPYDDSFGIDGFLLYKYRGTDPQHYENVGLRKAFFRKAPLIYFHGVVPGKYLAVWPVFIIGDSPEDLTFKVAVDDINSIKKTKAGSASDAMVSEDGSEARRVYIIPLPFAKNFISSAFVKGYWLHIRNSVRSASFGTGNCSMPPTSYLITNRG